MRKRGEDPIRNEVRVLGGSPPLGGFASFAPQTTRGKPSGLPRVQVRTAG